MIKNGDILYCVNDSFSINFYLSNATPLIFGEEYEVDAVTIINGRVGVMLKGFNKKSLETGIRHSYSVDRFAKKNVEKITDSFSYERN